MFLIHVQIEFCLHFPVDVRPYVCFVLVCARKEAIVKQHIRGFWGVFLYLEEIMFLHLCRFNSLYIKVCKTTKGQKTNCIQLVLATQNVCVLLNKAKRFQLFQNPFGESDSKNAGRYSRSLVLNLKDTRRATSHDI